VVLYSGHFSFWQPSAEGDHRWHGVFTILVEAVDADTAAEKCASLIERLNTQRSLFERVERIYMDTLIEINEIPDEGLIGYWVEWNADPQPRRLRVVRTTLPGVSEEHAVAYEDEPELIAGDEGSGGTEPFMEFFEGRRLT
jgi:hypothetical protein